MEKAGSLEDRIKKIKRYSSSKFCIAFFLLVFSLCFSNSIVGWFTANDFSKRIEVTLNGKEPEQASGCITSKDLGQLKENFKNGCVSYENSEAGTAASSSDGGAQANVRIMMTGHLQINFLQIQLVRGSYFTYEACEYGRNVAVISEALAKKLFSSYDVIGKDLYLFDDRKYKIIGLYHEKYSVLSFLSSDGMDRVFIPFESREGNLKAAIKTLLIRDSSLEQDKFRTSGIAAFLNGMGIEADNYRINDFYISRVVLAQPELAFLFLTGMVLFIFILKIAANYLKATLSNIKAALDSRYLMDALKSEVSSLGLAAAILAGAGVSAFVLLRAVSFTPYIGSGIIPAENIFDVGHYVEVLKNTIHYSNLSFGYIPSDFENAYSNALKLVILFFVITVAAFINAVSGVRLARLARYGAMDITRSTLFTLVAALLTSWLITHFSGLQLVIPIEGIVIISGFILLSEQGAHFRGHL